MSGNLTDTIKKAVADCENALADIRRGKRLSCKNFLY